MPSPSTTAIATSAVWVSVRSTSANVIVPVAVSVSPSDAVIESSATSVTAPSWSAVIDVIVGASFVPVIVKVIVSVSVLSLSRPSSTVIV